MAIRPEDLPSDPAALAEMVLAFDCENEDLRAQGAAHHALENVDEVDLGIDAIQPGRSIEARTSQSD